jgi:N-acetylglucosamine-6-phosphate deacetylase
MDTAICLHNANVLTGFSVMQNCAVYIKNDKIADVYSEQRFQQKKFSPKVKIINVNGAYIAPGFIDTHIHGIGGFSADDADSKSILKMSDILASYGVTSFIPTIGATPEKQLMPKIKAVLKAMGREKGAHILGIHLEGPFLSPERIGGQEQEGISPVDLAYMERIYKTAKGKIINMTVAPELKGMRDLALYCIEKGIILQAGHTNATYDQMIEGMQANIMHVTHMFNAMRPLHHREPGTVGAALTHPEISCEIIGDGVHVNPNLIQLLMKSKPLSQLVLITDSLKYAKAEIPADADFYFDQCFKRKADNVIIGSGITMLDGFKNLVCYGIPPEKAIRMASVNPAKIMQQPHKGLIIPGYDADLVVFNQDFDIIHTIIDGQFLKEK